MKKSVLILMLMLTTIFLISGCGAEDEDEEAGQGAVWGNEEKLRSTDAAIFRSAKAAATLVVLSGESVAKGTVYNFNTGEFGGKAADNKGKCSIHRDAYIVFDSSVEGYIRWTTNGTDTVDPCK